MENIAKEKKESPAEEPPDAIIAEGGCCTITTVHGSISTVDELSNYLPLNDFLKEKLQQVSELYHMLIPAYYFSLIKDINDSNDPIRMQSVPSIDEINDNDNDNIDPLGEERTSVTPYLVHRYPDRVLFLVTSQCFMYCRHCTRKRLWKSDFFSPTISDINQAANYIRENSSIREVIVSGGDPLTLSNDRLDYILSQLSSIKTIQAIRIGTRAPVVFPDRIDKGLCKVLSKYENLWINLQFNHPSEITKQSTEACRKLQKCGIPLNNQSVLLKGINDTPEVMKELCQKLQSIRVRPYYIFQCDHVVGASHFRTPVQKGIEILEKMRGHTGGMCVPTFVVDGPGGKGKIPLAPNYVLSMSEDCAVLRNYKHEVIYYSNL